jgi:hypothetical protein
VEDRGFDSPAQVQEFFVRDIPDLELIKRPAPSHFPLLHIDHNDSVVHHSQELPTVSSGECLNKDALFEFLIVIRFHHRVLYHRVEIIVDLKNKAFSVENTRVSHSGLISFVLEH